MCISKRSKQQLALVSAAVLTATVAYAGEATIRVSGFPNDSGSARIILMKDEAGYQGTQEAERVVQVPIRDNQITWTAVGIPAGHYAVMVHHDADADDDLNRPVFGLPLEPYGFSNGAWTSFGLPAWQDVSFSIGDGPVRQSIRLRMNAFAVFAQMAAIGVPSMAAIFAALAVIRLRRNRTQIT